MGWFERLSGSDQPERERKVSLSERIEISRYLAHHPPLKPDESFRWDGNLFTGYHLRAVKSGASSDLSEVFQRTTVGATLRPQPAPDKLTQIDDEFGKLRDETRFLSLDVANEHNNVLKLFLGRRTEEKIRTGASELLVDLSERRGLGWSDIARLVGVSVPAVRKWRQGCDMKAGRLHDLARLSAFLDLIEESGIADPGMWLQTPLFYDLSRGMTKAEVYSAGHVLELLAYANDHVNLEHILAKMHVTVDAASPQVQFVKNPDGSTSMVPSDA